MIPVFSKTTILSTSICAAIAVSCGCTVQTVHPLRDCGKVVLDDRILGDWQEWEPEFGKSDDHISILRDDRGRYRVSTKDEGDAIDLTGYLVKFGGHHYIELQDSRMVDRLTPSSSTSLSTHLFARVEIEENELTISFPDHVAFNKAVSGGELTGIVENEGFLVTRVVLTSPADKLREFIAANPNSLFDEPVKFRRAESKDRSDE